MADAKVAIILAAGRGERMRPLTDHTPKPLLNVAGQPLISYTLQRLTKAGCGRVIINCAYLGEQLPAALGNGERFALDIRYSHEDEALETAGGIIQALPLIDAEKFLVINGDVWCDHSLQPLFDRELGQDLAHLVMVDNPTQHPFGDFRLQNTRLQAKPTRDSLGLTYSGIGLYTRALFENYPKGYRPLRPLLDKAMQDDRISGEHYRGDWRDIGTPERLAALNTDLS